MICFKEKTKDRMALSQGSALRHHTTAATWKTVNFATSGLVA
jgi:hypothetical protein